LLSVGLPIAYGFVWLFRNEYLLITQRTSSSHASIPNPIPHMLRLKRFSLFKLYYQKLPLQFPVNEFKETIPVMLQDGRTSFDWVTMLSVIRKNYRAISVLIPLFCESLKSTSGEFITSYHEILLHYYNEHWKAASRIPSKQLRNQIITSDIIATLVIPILQHNNRRLCQLLLEYLTVVRDPFATAEIVNESFGINPSDIHELQELMKTMKEEKEQAERSVQILHVEPSTTRTLPNVIKPKDIVSPHS
jgi:hypothetical protein